MQQSSDHRRLHLIVNSRSGHGAGEQIKDLARTICDNFGAELIVYPVETPSDIPMAAEKAIKSCHDPRDIIVAAGGDGTVRCVAEAVSRTRHAFAIIPCGTFNYFARTHGIPEDFSEALKVALTGNPTPVRVGEINGRIFLNNAGLGVYAESIVERELSTKRFGRHRIVVLFSTLSSLLRPRRLLKVSFVSHGIEKVIRTPMVFVGNNSLQLKHLSLSVADCFKKNLLAVVTLTPARFWNMIILFFRHFFSSLDNDRHLIEFGTDSMTILTHQIYQRVALDGEIFEMRSPLKIERKVDALRLVIPEGAPA